MALVFKELMVPYAALSEAAKDLDRSAVKAVYDAIEQAQRHAGQATQSA